MAERISTAGKIGLVAVTAKAIFAALTRLVISPFRGSKGASTYLKDVAMAFLRSQLRNMTIPQSKFLNKPTTDVYHDLAKRHKFKPASVTLSSGIQAHWIGNPNAKVVFVYLHGGGYVLPASLGLMQYIYDLTRTMADTGADIATLVLAYTLAPEAKYPTQLAQAAQLLQHLLELIVGGDSAGGNLTLSLLSHILHLHPSSDPAVPRITLKQPLRGALLLSPWVSFDYNHASFARNAESDMFDAVPLMVWARLFLGVTGTQSAVAGDSYSEPLRAEPGWWSGANKVVNDVMIWGGGREVLIDGIRAFSKAFIKGWNDGGGSEDRVVYVETPGGAHDDMIVDSALGYKNSPAGMAVAEWMKSRL